MAAVVRYLRARAIVLTAAQDVRTVEEEGGGRERDKTLMATLIVLPPTFHIPQGCLCLCSLFSVLFLLKGLDVMRILPI